jgi:hypothetical protein
MPLPPTLERRESRSRRTRVVRLSPAVQAVRAAHASRRSTLGPSTSGFRLEASPPSLRHAPDSAWNRFVFWLLAPSPQEAAPPLNRLPLVREDFLHALADLPGEAAHAARDRVTQSHSLRDLWHLRAEVFRLVGIEHSQWEAEQRLLRLNRHFPMRTPRSQFGAL